MFFIDFISNGRGPTMTRKITFFISIIVVLMIAIPAMAVSPKGEQYVNQIVGGDSTSMRQAAQSIYNNEFKERVVLDVLAEKLIQTYNDTDSTTMDAVAWACKALGRSGNVRYRNILNTVNDNAKKYKVRKYAKQSLKMMPDGKAKYPYKKGSVNLAAMKKRLEKGQPALTTKRKSKSKKSKKKKPVEQKIEEEEIKTSISSIRKGMSLQEVISITGSPTSTSSRVTGKTLNPFYYGSDHARLIHLYKGQGRVLYSQKASYSNVWRVIEVQLNPGEKGYP
jgi:hypothetical protein